MDLPKSKLDLEEQILSRKWFYRFELPSGRTTETYSPPEVDSIHPTRLEMLFAALEPVAGGRWQDLTVIDLAGHQGYFAHHLAKRRVADLLLVDVRTEHLADARQIAAVFDLDNVRFAEHDLARVDAAALGTFDVTVMFGLLYHVEDPIGLLRLARQVTRRVLVVETQVTPNLDGVTDWGSRLYPQAIHGGFALIDESPELDGNESGTSGLCLCPSVEAVVFLMKKFGFDRVEVIPPPPDGNEQLVRGRRAVIAGYLDEPPLPLARSTGASRPLRQRDRGVRG